MDWRELSREVADKLNGNPALADERPIICIDSRKQQLFWVDIDAENNTSYPVSTAANGMGNRMDSFKTPSAFFERGFKESFRFKLSSG